MGEPRIYIHLDCVTSCVTIDHVMCSVCRNHNPVLSSFMTYHWVCNKRYTTVPHVGQKLLTLPEHLSPPRVLVGFVFLDL